MWEDYEREGTTGLLRWAAQDARWRAHSAGGRISRGTALYCQEVERARDAGVRAAGLRDEMWSHDDVVVVRGRTREDAQLYWLHRVRDRKVVWTSSSPDLSRLLLEAGLEPSLTPWH